MELDEREPTVLRALALALLRQALTYITTIGEDEAAGHLRSAIDVLLRPKPSGRTAPVA